MIGSIAIHAFLLLTAGAASAQKLPPAAAQTCYVEALRSLDTRFLTASDAALLCFWATSNAPIDCYRSASPYLSSSDRALLCSGARSNAPLDCYDASPKFGLSQHGSALLCSGATAKAPRAPVDCWDATGRSLNAEDSALLCSGAASNAPVDCFDASYRLLDKDAALRFCSPREKLCQVRQPGNRNHCTSVLP